MNPNLMAPHRVGPLYWNDSSPYRVPLGRRTVRFGFPRCGLGLAFPARPAASRPIRGRRCMPRKRARGA